MNEDIKDIENIKENIDLGEEKDEEEKENTYENIIPLQNGVEALSEVSKLPENLPVMEKSISSPPNLPPKQSKNKLPGGSKTTQNFYKPYKSKTIREESKKMQKKPPKSKMINDKEDLKLIRAKSTIHNKKLPNTKDEEAKPKKRGRRLSGTDSMKISKLISKNECLPRTNLSRLSINLHSLILSYLEIKEIFKISTICRSLREHAELEWIWRERLLKESKTSPNIENVKMRVLCQHSVLKNYFRSKYRSFICKGHDRMITSIDIDGNLILTGSKDNTVKMWNIQTKKNFTFEGHFNQITKVMLLNKMPISASADRTIRIWSTNPNEEHRILKGHKYPIAKLRAFNDNLFISSSTDGEVKLWNLKGNKCVETYTDHSGAVKRIDINPTYLVSYGEDDGNIIFRDITKNQIFTKITKKTIQNTNPTINNKPVACEIGALNLTENNILFTGETRRIRLWDIRKKILNPDLEFDLEVENQIRNPFIPVRYYNSPPNLIIASAGNRIRFQSNLNLLVATFGGTNGLVTFDIRNPTEHLYYYNYHYYPVTSFDTGKYFNEHIAVSSGTSKILQYDLRIIDLREEPAHKCNGSRIVPGHKSVITTLKMKDGVIATGGKNGDVRALNFISFSPEMKVLPLVTKLEALGNKSNQI